MGSWLRCFEPLLLYLLEDTNEYFKVVKSITCSKENVFPDLVIVFQKQRGSGLEGNVRDKSSTTSLCSNIWSHSSYTSFRDLHHQSWPISETLSD